MSKFVFVDLDHTISHAWWRDHMIGGDWDEYHRLAKEDKPILPMAAMLRSLYADHWRTIGLTSRPEKWRIATMDWCFKHNIWLEELIMRPNENYQQANELKQTAIIDRLRGVPLPLVLVFDDREDVVAAIKCSGINCMIMHVHKSDGEW